MTEASTIASKAGFLALEDYAKKLPKDIPSIFLSDMILFCADGMEPEWVIKIYLYRYCSLGLNGYLGLTYLLYLQGVLAIQAGVHTDVMAMLLKAMLPEKHA